MEGRITAKHLNRYITIALFCALAYASTLIFRIPVSFLTFDLKDAIIVTGAMFFGPVAGIVIALLTSLIELTISSTGIYGLIMNFSSSAVFALVSSLFYTYKKRLSRAILGLCVGVLSMTAVMLLLNIFVTPFYMGVDRSLVISMIPTLFLPFNLIKGTINASLTMVIYKPISNALNRSGLIHLYPSKCKREKKTHGKLSIVISLVSVAIAVACILILILVFDGKFVFFGLRLVQ